jgi:uridine monophosphate synthetase
MQYTGGPLTIVRWAPIVNASILSGPGIITALSQAADQAIAAHNTSVSTEIRASPKVPALELEDDDDDDHDTYEPTAPCSEEEFEQDYSHPRFNRKQSVVSVSTTISMKSEALSPQTHMRPSVARVSSSDDDDDEGDDLEALDHLGPPPFFRSLLLLAQMSSANNYFLPEITAACLKHAREHKEFVMGFIAQQSLNEKPDDNFITMTPGVQLQQQARGDAQDQQYNTPAKVIGEGGSDVIIVGRGIIASPDRRAAALEYRRQGWKAYRERVRLLRPKW